MLNVSIFEKKWIDLVFEDKNKEYGAYKLRQENPKTALVAFVFGLLFVISISGLGLLLSSFDLKPISEKPAKDNGFIIHLSDLKPPKNNFPKSNIIPINPPKSKKQITNKDLKNPEIVKSSENPDEIAKKNRLSKASDSPENSSVNESTTTTTSGGATGGTSGLVIPKLNDETPKNAGVLDKMPTFPGGIDKFRQYIGDHFEKPDVDIEKTVTVYVSFVIEKDGTMTDIKVVRDPGFGLATEAVRVFKSLKTKWEAGILNGEKVRTAYSLGIAIKID